MAPNHPVPRVLGRPECPDTASIKDPEAFNAHSSTAGGSGLVQSVFSLPARLPTWVPARVWTPVRRAAKLKTLFIAELGINTYLQLTPCTPGSSARRRGCRHRTDTRSRLASDA